MAETSIRRPDRPRTESSRQQRPDVVCDQVFVLGPCGGHRDSCQAAVRQSCGDEPTGMIRWHIDCDLSAVGTQGDEAEVPVGPPHEQLGTGGRLVGAEGSPVHLGDEQDSVLAEDVRGFLARGWSQPKQTYSLRRRSSTIACGGSPCRSLGTSASLRCRRGRMPGGNASCGPLCASRPGRWGGFTCCHVAFSCACRPPPGRDGGVVWIRRYGSVSHSGNQLAACCSKQAGTVLTARCCCAGSPV